MLFICESINTDSTASFPLFAKGGLGGGGPGGTPARYAVRVLLDPAGARAEGQGPPLRSKCWLCPVHPP